MKRTTWILGTVAALAAAMGAMSGAPGAQAGSSRKGEAALAAIEARSGSSVKGQADFIVSSGKVTMTVTVTGLTPGSHAIHLHEKGDCSDPGAKSAGAHWNPTNAQHGRWGEGSFHRGDIGHQVAPRRPRGRAFGQQPALRAGLFEDQQSRRPMIQALPA